MEILLKIFTILGLVILGFLLAEFQNAWLGKQEKGKKEVFAFIGVIITQKDVQRLLFALILAFVISMVLPYLKVLTGYDLEPKIIYLIVGYTPSTVMLFIEKKIKKQ